MSGPLQGLKVVEVAGLGPAPFAGMLLADLGAQVLRIDRPLPPLGREAISTDPRHDVLARGRAATWRLDLKAAGTAAQVLQVVAQADVLIEGFRPGVMERLGLGPDVCLAHRPSLVYGRMTGWGQQGPLAGAVGHDIDYLALTGALHAIGTRDGPPVVPLNLVGDFGGGGMLLAFGVMCAVHEAQRSGRGQVVDAAMVDGIASLTAMVHGFRAAGLWSGGRGENLLDGGAPFYATYRCADGGYVAVGAIEGPFYAALRRGLGLEHEALFDAPLDRARWPAQRQRLDECFAARSRDDWCRHFEGTDACVAPVLDWDEAAAHPHLAARGTYVEVDGVRQPAPAPRFSRTPGGIMSATGDVNDLLRSWGVGMQSAE